MEKHIEKITLLPWKYKPHLGENIWYASLWQRGLYLKFIKKSQMWWKWANATEILNKNMERCSTFSVTRKLKLKLQWDMTLCLPECLKLKWLTTGKTVDRNSHNLLVA